MSGTDSGVKILCLMAVSLLILGLCRYIVIRPTDCGLSPDEGLKKKDWIRVGQCMLDCKQMKNTCFRYCVTSAHQGRLLSYTGSTAETLLDVIQAEDDDGRMSWKYYVFTYHKETYSINLESPFVLLYPSESQRIKDLWFCNDWSTETQITMRKRRVYNRALLVISSRGLVAEKSFSPTVTCADDDPAVILCSFGFVALSVIVVYKLNTVPVRAATGRDFKSCGNDGLNCIHSETMDLDEVL